MVEWQDVGLAQERSSDQILLSAEFFVIESSENDLKKNLISGVLYLK